MFECRRAALNESPSDGAALSKDTKIVVGGESAVLHKSTIDEIGGILADSFSDYRDIIAGLRQGYVN